MTTSKQTLVDLETKFWQSMVDEDTDTALQMLNVMHTETPAKGE